VNVLALLAECSRRALRRQPCFQNAYRWGLTLFLRVNLSFECSMRFSNWIADVASTAAFTGFCRERLGGAARPDGTRGPDSPVRLDQTGWESTTASLAARGAKSGFSAKRAANLCCVGQRDRSYNPLQRGNS
jgi:hypothetical protein